jgi:BNR repeat-like domain
MKKLCFWNFAALGLITALLMFTGCGSGSSNSSETNQQQPPAVVLTRLSSDPYTNASSQHATEVEPDTFAFGSTVVSAFQVARISQGGGADIGFATTTDGGTTWSSGFLPGITIFQDGGSFSAASDAAVAYDAAQATWLISSLGLGATNHVLVSRSLDGITWNGPIAVSTGGDPDKNWIVCDNTASSPFFGHCYVEWDDVAAQDRIQMSTSTDGGLTWGAAQATANSATGLGGQPLVQPNGKVIVPILGISNTMLAFSSSDGGTTWSSATIVADVTDHAEHGGLRSSPLLSAEIDSAGTVYVVWSDCRFRTNCTANDLVLSKSSDGVTWSRPARIPIDPTTSTVDHFIPGLAVDPATSGNSAHLGVAYYYYPTSNCGSVCNMNVGFVSSQDGGSTWSAAEQLAGPMMTNWLPNTFSGRMVADYISTSYVNGKAIAVFAVAKTPNGNVFDQAIYTPTMSPAQAGAHFSSAREKPVAHAKSDHGRRRFYDLDHEHPIPPRRRASRAAK